MSVVSPDLKRAFECEAILRTLPMWFGIEHALLMYARDSAEMPTFGLTEEDRLIEFLTLQEHFPHAWEVHCIAISAAARGVTDRRIGASP